MIESVGNTGTFAVGVPINDSVMAGGGKVADADAGAHKALLSESATQPEESLPSDVPVLRRAAMDCLARREHSYYELTQKLLLKFPDASGELIDEVLSQLRDEGLQSDERFTEAYVRHRKSKSVGYLHIKADLVQRKVPLPIINTLLY